MEFFEHYSVSCTPCPMIHECVGVDLGGGGGEHIYIYIYILLFRYVFVVKGLVLWYKNHGCLMIVIVHCTCNCY